MGDRPDRTDRLAAQVTHAERLRTLAGPNTCYLLRVLGALAPEDLEELGRWQLRDERAEAIVDRITAALSEPRQVVPEVLGNCLRLDVWGDYEACYAEPIRHSNSAAGGWCIWAKVGNQDRLRHF